MKKWIKTLAITVLASVLCWRAYVRVMAAGAAVNQGPLFHDLAQGNKVNFVVRGASDIHLMSYYVMPENSPTRTTYSLQVSFLAPDGAVRERRTVSLPVTTTVPTLRLPDGAAVAQSRLLHLMAPPDAALLQIASPDGRLLLRANRLVQKSGTQDVVLARTGLPATWFAPDEVQGFLPHGWMPLPAVEQTAIVKLPFTEVVEREIDSDLDGSGPMRVGPHHALVFNVVGPGTLTVAPERPGGGHFQIEHVGPGGSGQAPLQDGRATVTLPAGPSSVIIRPLEEKEETVQVFAQDLRALGRSDAKMEPAMRLGSAWRIETSKPLRFPVYGNKSHPGPVRLTARALDMTAAAQEPMRWRFVSEDGEALLSGTLPLEHLYDPFTGVLVEGTSADIGNAAKTFLTPPAGAAALEVSGPRGFVEVDALLEASAQAEPLPPYDVALTPALHWQEVPVRSPRWLMLRPLASQSEQRQLYATLLRTPRIEAITGLPEGPWMSVEPRGSVKKVKILEPTQNPALLHEAQTLASTEHDTQIVVEPEGKNARRVVLTCEIQDALGGELTLRVDGKRAASAPISTSTVRLAATAEAGIHRVRVDGATEGRCTIAARPVSGAITVPRTVYAIPSSSHGLSLKVSTRGREPIRLHYAIYSEVSGHRAAKFAVLVDRGQPKRRTGSSLGSTLGRTNQLLRFATVSLPSHGLHSGSSLGRVAVSSVQLGDDLPSGHHKVELRALSSGRYWARFWVLGKGRKAPVAESWITTDLTAASEVQE